jgi:hypothetical protein
MKITENWHGATCFVTIRKDPQDTHKQMNDEIMKYLNRYPYNPFETKLTQIREDRDGNLEAHFERHGCE